MNIPNEKGTRDRATITCAYETIIYAYETIMTD